VKGRAQSPRWVKMSMHPVAALPQPMLHCCACCPPDPHLLIHLWEQSTKCSERGGGDAAWCLALGRPTACGRGAAHEAPPLAAAGPVVAVVTRVVVKQALVPREGRVGHHRHAAYTGLVGAQRPARAAGFDAALWVRRGRSLHPRHGPQGRQANKPKLAICTEGRAVAAVSCGRVASRCRVCVRWKRGCVL
jgi:hypothetical protein